MCQLFYTHTRYDKPEMSRKFVVLLAGIKYWAKLAHVNTALTVELIDTTRGVLYRGFSYQCSQQTFEQMRASNSTIAFDDDNNNVILFHGASLPNTMCEIRNDTVPVNNIIEYLKWVNERGNGARLYIFFLVCTNYSLVSSLWS